MRPPPGLTVAPVRNGRGIVATRPFRAGALVCRIGGRIVSASRLWTWWDSDPQRAANCLRFDRDRYLDPGAGIGAFLNHSCEANTRVVPRGRFLELRALRVIRAGSEVTHDYSTLIAPDDVWTMRCNCGAPKCRGVVRRIDQLPRALFRSHQASGAIPAFVLALMPSDGMKPAARCKEL